MREGGREGGKGMTQLLQPKTFLKLKAYPIPDNGKAKLQYMYIQDMYRYIRTCYTSHTQTQTHTGSRMRTQSCSMSSPRCRSTVGRWTPPSGGSPSLPPADRRDQPRPPPSSSPGSVPRLSLRLSRCRDLGPPAASHQPCLEQSNTTHRSQLAIVNLVHSVFYVYMGMQCLVQYM